MDISTVLELVKARLGIKSNVRDTYISSIITGLIKELKESQGLELDVANAHHLMFIVDYTAWRYSNRDEPNGMPRHLQWRLHNLIIGGAKNE